MNGQISIRASTPADASVCTRIAFDAFGGIARAHNFPLDFAVPEATAGLMAMVLNHPKGFGVVAECDGAVIGSNFLDRRDRIATVGPISVDPKFQGRGVGRRLMEAVIERGHADGHPGIRLVQDAFNTKSMSLYASLGFDIKEPLALMQGIPKTAETSSGQVAPIVPADIAECAEVCRSVHGVDRANELRDAIDHFQPMLLRKDGQVVAYASAPHFWFMNHGVARAEQDMFDLLSAVAAERNTPLALLVPTRQASFHRWCLRHGMRMLKPMSLMAMGEYHEPRGCFYTSVAW
jgi:predicted N-acetyltransferase YhbS